MTNGLKRDLKRRTIGGDAASFAPNTKTCFQGASRLHGGRDMALQVLLRVERGEPVQAALDQILSNARMHGETRDFGLCTEMVYGYLRTALRLEAILAQVLKSPQKLPASLRMVLGLGVYSLLFLHSVPDYAAVNWCVEFARRSFGKSMAGLANGVLRSVQRLGDAPLARDFYEGVGKTSLQSACLFYAVPLWMGQLWHDAYGAEACEHILARSFAQPRQCLRINVQHASRYTFRKALLDAGGCEVGAHGLAFEPGQCPATILGVNMKDWHEQGVFSWQAAGSLAALDGDLEGLSTLSTCWQYPVWDCCAGQGGKSLALMERGGDVALCSDIHVGRLRLLCRTAKRLDLSCPPLARMRADVPALQKWRGTILLDAPCSGLGTIARRPEIRFRRKSQDIEGLVQLQARMLQAVWSVLTTGSHLVYMTCTLNPDENEKQVQALLLREPSARVVSTWQTPHHHSWLEGMFVAVVQKK